MLIISQNLLHYDVKFKANTVLRVNLAWTMLKELKKTIRCHSKKTIFLDLPINRIKPPNNSYSIDDLIPILRDYTNIKYLAVSNVEKKEDLFKYKKIIPDHITIVPKIESVKGIMNIKEIINELEVNNKIVMLDHDDLFSSIIKSKKPVSIFTNYISKLVVFCKKNKITLLRTVGVVFSDDEFRTTQYIR
jgi:citrate lyase beta subunit